MVPLINKTENFRSLRDLSNGIECDLGSDKVIILTACFCKVLFWFRGTQREDSSKPLKH